MGVVLDSSILIGVEKGHIDLEKKIKGKEELDFFLSVISASELLHGIWRAQTAKVQSRRSAFVEEILTHFPIIEIDLNIARIHAQLWAQLIRKGKLIGSHDLWIAATCIAYGHTLITLNTKEFKIVPGLKLEKW